MTQTDTFIHRHKGRPDTDSPPISIVWSWNWQFQPAANALEWFHLKVDLKWALQGKGLHFIKSKDPNQWSLNSPGKSELKLRQISGLDWLVSNRRYWNQSASPDPRSPLTPTLLIKTDTEYRGVAHIHGRATATYRQEISSEFANERGRLFLTEHEMTRQFNSRCVEDTFCAPCSGTE